MQRPSARCPKSPDATIRPWGGYARCGRDSDRTQPGMGLPSELQYPTRWYSKLVVIVVAVTFFLSLFTATISAYVLYRILHPTVTHLEIGGAEFPGHPENFSFSVPGIGQRSGLFFPGLRGAPTILLCHGYGSSRGELLTLASSLQDRQYNVFLFDFAGHGESGGLTSLGLLEPREVEAAVSALARRDDVDPHTFGAWGTNLGAYAAIASAERDPRIRAIALESAYDTPDDLLRWQIRQSGMARLPFVERLTVKIFQWKNRDDRSVEPVSKHEAALGGVYKLFLSAADEPMLGAETRQIADLAPDPKQIAEIGSGNYASMADEAKRTYENRLLGFFLVNLPASR